MQHRRPRLSKKRTTLLASTVALAAAAGVTVAQADESSGWGADAMEFESRRPRQLLCGFTCTQGVISYLRPGRRARPGLPLGWRNVRSVELA